MKRLLFFLPLLIFLDASSQIAISNLPTHVGNAGTGYVPVVISGQTRKATGNQLAWNKVDSVTKSNDTVYSWKNGVRSFAFQATYGWGLNGNAGLNWRTNFIGTTDSVPLVGKVEGITALRLTPLGGTYLDSSKQAGIYLGNGAGIADTNTIRNSIAIGTYALTKYAGGEPGSGQIAIGHQALTNYVGGVSTGSNIAIGTRSQARNIDAYRVVSVGLNTHHNIRHGARNTAVGSLAGEWHDSAFNNDAFGESSLRYLTKGVGNVAIGNNSLFYTSGGAQSVSMVSSSSDWTTANVVFSAPNLAPFGFNGSVQAQGTAIIVGNQIVGVDITEPGIGYTYMTISFTGDGTSATATVTVGEPMNNTALGVGTLFRNRMGYGNTAIGASAGGGLSDSDPNISVNDTAQTYIGFNAGRNLANPLTARLRNSTAIGYNAKVAQSNSLILGAIGADQPTIGIGIQAPDLTKMFDINGKSRFRDTIFSDKTALLTNNIVANQNALVVNNTFNPIYSGTFTTNALVDGAALKIVTNGTTDNGLSIIRGRAGNFGGASITFYRTNNNDPSVKTAVVPIQSIFQLLGYGVAGDNSTVVSAGLLRLRTLGVKTTTISGYWDFQLRDTNGVVGTKVMVRPHDIVVGESVEGTQNPSAMFSVESTNKGFLPPRMTAAQRLAIASPVAGLIVYDSDSSGLFLYNGSLWHRLIETNALPTSSFGTYTPTVTPGSNFDSAIPFEINWTRTGNVVHYTGSIQINATATGGVSCELSLPPGITSDFVSTTDAPGGISPITDVVNGGHGGIFGNPTTNNLLLSVNATTTNDFIYTFTGSFKIL